MYPEMDLDGLYRGSELGEGGLDLDYILADFLDVGEEEGIGWTSTGSRCGGVCGVEVLLLEDEAGDGPRHEDNDRPQSEHRMMIGDPTG